MGRSKMVKTVEDLFAHFGADFEAGDALEENSKRLSRRIYKDTSCGAWASVSRRPVWSMKTSVWEGRYVNKRGVWSFDAARTRGHKWRKPDDLPFDVVDYFSPTGVPEADISAVVGEKADPQAASYIAPRSIEVRRQRGTKIVVAFGSIVEGIDAQVGAYTIRLPCKASDLDRMIERIEKEANDLWNDTHGCEACGGENELGYRTINPACAECDGQGTII